MNPDAARSLATLLGDTVPLWRPAPFHDDPPWVHDAPAAAGALLSLDDAGIDALEADPAALAARAGELFPVLARLQAAADACIDNAVVPAPLPLAEAVGRDVPGRKWKQLLHFTAACGRPVGPAVDWCSGKGHLGRLVARLHGTPVTCVERDPALCHDGAGLSRRDGLAVRFVQADALRVTGHAAGLGPGAHALALHACGDLHLALLQAGATAGVAALDVAPCCYHLTAAPHWTPLSTALHDCALAGLPLSRDDLRLAVQEAVTSSERVRRQQRELAAWRLGFDHLQRELRGSNTYLPTPPRPARVLADGFEAFCRDLAGHHRLYVPAATDFGHHRRAGEARAARVRRLELVRHACRRPLEVLLVADRALFLAEYGYRVRVQRFCPRQLTPRNLLIQARRPAGRQAGATARQPE